MLLIAQSALAAATVNADGSADYATLTDAVYAGERDIHLAAGTYAPVTGEAFPLALADGTVITGEGAESSVLNGEGGTFFTSSGSYTLAALALTDGQGTNDNTLYPLVASDTIVLDRVAVSHSSSSGAGIAYFMYAGSYSITDSDFEECGGVGASDREASSVVGSTFGATGRVYAGLISSSVFREVAAVSVLGGNVDNVLMVGGGDSSVNLPCISLANGATIRNSTIVGCRAATALIGSATNTVVAYASNIGIDPDGGTVSTSLVYGSGVQDYVGEVSAGNLSADPLFVAYSDDGDWANDDFRPAAGSPAIDAGGGDFPTTDLQGAPRPLDGNDDDVVRADIGAYEYGDADGDGWYRGTGGDCDDAEVTINPDAPDVPDDGIDQDCDGEDAHAPVDTGHDTAEDSGFHEVDSAGETPDDTGINVAGGCDCQSPESAVAWLPGLLAVVGAAGRRRRLPRGSADVEAVEADERDDVLQRR